jgi:hypothetical protein
LGSASFEDPDFGTVELETKALTVSALAIAEIGVVDLYARLGMANWQAEIDIEDLGSVSDDGWEPTYGVGIGAHFGSLGLRAEFETFDADGLDNNTLSLSFTYTFL